jgi:hypothetical protein
MIVDGVAWMYELAQQTTVSKAIVIMVQVFIVFLLYFVIEVGLTVISFYSLNQCTYFH